MLNEINATLLELERLVPDAPIRSENRTNTRSMLPFIGDIGRSLFGVATTGDIRAIARHINALTKQTNLMTTTLKQHGDHFSSYISTVNEKLRHVTDAIKLNHEEFQTLKTQLNINELTLFQSSTFMELTSVKILTQSVHMQKELHHLKMGITDMVRGLLSPVLISHSLLTSTLTDIQSILNTKYPGYSLVSYDPNYYYTTSELLYYRRGPKLYISVKFPVAAHPFPFTTYRVLTFPVPVNDSSLDATQLLDLPDNLLLSHNEKHYTSMSNAAMSNCRGSSLLYCKHRAALTPRAIVDCLSSLFYNNIANVKAHCNFRFRQNVIYPHLLDLLPTSVLVYRTPELTLECANGTTTIPGCSYCTLSIPCNCAILTDDIYFTGLLTHCDTSDSITRLHPLNLALLQQFFNTTSLGNMSATTAFSKPIPIVVPPFKIYNHTMNQLLAADSKTDLNLQKMANAVKSDKTIFTSLADSIASGEVTIESDDMSFSTIMAYCAAALSVINFLASLWFMYRFKQLATMVMFRQVASEPIPTFRYALPSTTPMPDFAQLISSFLLWDHAIFFISVLSLLLLVGILASISRRRSKHMCIVVHIASPSDCVSVTVLNVPICPVYWEFQYPKAITSVSVVDTSFPKLHLTWPEFQLKNTLSNQVMNVPSIVKISPFVAHRIRHMIHQPYIVFPMVSHQGILHPIPPPIDQPVKQPEVPQRPVSLYPSLMS